MRGCNDNLHRQQLLPTDAARLITAVVERTLSHVVNPLVRTIVWVFTDARRSVITVCVVVALTSPSSLSNDVVEG